MVLSVKNRRDIFKTFEQLFPTANGIYSLQQMMQLKDNVIAAVSGLIDARPDIIIEHFKAPKEFSYVGNSIKVIADGPASYKAKLLIDGKEPRFVRSVTIRLAMREAITVTIERLDLKTATET